ncbi:MAG TPA: hypothetical protein VFC19_07325 [Candidatus Limnocylindrales bacterium]|nr:hypothetical protein [Candidatus Limnocylindrales bacterium]
MSSRVIYAVLPCAGAGLRFGAPYPKELHCIAAGTTMLDLALAPLLDLAAEGAQIRLVAVLSAAKMATARYLHRYADRFCVVMTYQTPAHGSDLRGALAAATPLCTGDTVLVLPDQSYQWDPARNPIRALLARLEREDWAVLASPVTDPTELASEGALRLEPIGGTLRVTAAAEKPADPTPYNAAWVSVAVAAPAVAELTGLVGANGRHPLVGASAVQVKGYRNATTPGSAT